MTATRPRLGEMLVSRGLLSEQQLAIALAEQRESRERLGSILVRRRLVTQHDLFRTLADSLGVTYVDLDDVVVDERAARLLPEGEARRLLSVPLYCEGSRLVVAMGDPADVFTADDIRGITGWRVMPVLADGGRILSTIDRCWGRAPEAHPNPGGIIAAAGLAGDTTGGVAPAPRPTAVAPVEDTVAAVTSPEVTTFVEGMLLEALRQEATEIHLDPDGDELACRFRIGDALSDVFKAPPVLKDAVLQRLKILGELDLGQRGLPQGGWISVAVQDRRVDVRMVVLPTADGEAVSLRVRDASRHALSLADLGLLTRPFTVLTRALQRSAGLVVVSGPSGSGRSTTLYAALEALNDRARHVVTIEDPLEYRVPGARQIQVHPEIGLTFEVALRAALRAEPDVTLVGDVREGQTAALACEAALMGHLVLAGMHGSDAPSTLVRLCEMGVEPYLVTSAVACIVSQRLVKRLCQHCRVPEQDPDLGEELTEMGAGEAYFKPVGCDQCGGSGYAGRLAIHEVLAMSEEIARQVAASAGVSAVRVTAVQQGMTTFVADGLQKAAAGLTSLDELRRISG